MDSGVKKFHPISESETESNFSVSSKKVKAIGLMPRKDRACKGKKNTSVSTSSSCPKPIPSPIIDNTGSSRNLSVDDGEDAISSVSATVDQNLSQFQLDTMNDKLNKLIELANREHVDESIQLEDGQISDNEDIEDEEDSSIYFHSITEKDTKQGPTINEPLALGVTNILKSGLRI